MSHTSPTKSTNVRPAILAAAAWALLAASLDGSGALERLASDLPWLAAFAVVATALAYAVDEELRRAVQAQQAGVLAAGAAMLLAVPAAPAGLALAMLPPAVAFAAALVPRALRARFSSAAAASPGGTRGAP